MYLKTSSYTEKQLDVLLYLFKVRGATARQILNGVKGIKNVDRQGTEMKRMNEMLQRLEKKGAVTSYLTKQLTGRVHYLTDDGLADIQDLLNISINYQGTGLNSDFGYFTHSLYSPPKKGIDHFLMQTEVHNIVLNINKLNPGFLDYRDNMYCVQTFPYKTDDKKLTELKLRPDGEIRINNDIYFIEVDRGTERTEELSLKFSRYNQYLDYLKSENIESPKGVIFVKENRNPDHARRLVYGNEKRRYTNIRSIFNKNCKQHILDFNFLYCEVGKLHDLIIHLSDTSRNKSLAKALDFINEYNNELTNIRSMSVDEIRLLQVKSAASNDLYILGEAEGYESKVWSKAFSLFKQYRKQFDNTFFIAFYNASHSIPAYLPSEVGNLSDTKERDFYTNVFILNIAGNEPLWFDATHTVMETAPFSN
ncbi:replication-relaxation family protein [Viridibacillus arvi]|uniref:replication-relaxation family protein n=1 Tax=Viridibacillus arvi TaxID=263475 RepID=UPI0034CE9B32